MRQALALRRAFEDIAQARGGVPPEPARKVSPSIVAAWNATKGGVDTMSEVLKTIKAGVHYRGRLKVLVRLLEILAINVLRVQDIASVSAEESTFVAVRKASRPRESSLKDRVYELASTLVMELTPKAVPCQDVAIPFAGEVRSSMLHLATPDQQAWEAQLRSGFKDLFKVLDRVALVKSVAARELWEDDPLLRILRRKACYYRAKMVNGERVGPPELRTHDIVQLPELELGRRRNCFGCRNRVGSMCGACKAILCSSCTVKWHELPYVLWYEAKSTPKADSGASSSSSDASVATPMP